MTSWLHMACGCCYYPLIYCGEAITGVSTGLVAQHAHRGRFLRLGNYCYRVSTSSVKLSDQIVIDPSLEMPYDDCESCLLEYFLQPLPECLQSWRRSGPYPIAFTVSRTATETTAGTVDMADYLGHVVEYDGYWYEVVSRVNVHDNSTRYSITFTDWGVPEQPATGSHSNQYYHFIAKHYMNQDVSSVDLSEVALDDYVKVRIAGYGGFNWGLTGSCAFPSGNPVPWDGGYYIGLDSYESIDFLPRSACMGKACGPNNDDFGRSLIVGGPDGYVTYKTSGISYGNALWGILDGESWGLDGAGDAAVNSPIDEDFGYSMSQIPSGPWPLEAGALYLGGKRVFGNGPSARIYWSHEDQLWHAATYSAGVKRILYKGDGWLPHEATWTVAEGEPPAPVGWYIPGKWTLSLSGGVNAPNCSQNGNFVGQCETMLGTYTKVGGSDDAPDAIVLENPAA